MPRIDQQDYADKTANQQLLEALRNGQNNRAQNQQYNNLDRSTRGGSFRSGRGLPDPVPSLLQKLLEQSQRHFSLNEQRQASRDKQAIVYRDSVLKDLGELLSGEGLSGGLGGHGAGSGKGGLARGIGSVVGGAFRGVGSVAGGALSGAGSLAGGALSALGGAGGGRRLNNSHEVDAAVRRQMAREIVERETAVLAGSLGSAETAGRAGRFFGAAGRGVGGLAGAAFTRGPGGGFNLLGKLGLVGGIADTGLSLYKDYNETSPEGSQSFGRALGRSGHAAMGGAATGAMLGLGVGGPVGMLIGGIIGGVGSAVASLAVQYRKEIGKVMGSVGESVLKGATALGHAFSDIGSGFLKTMGEWITAPFKAAMGYIEKVSPGTAKWLNGKVQGVKDLAGRAWGGVKSFAGDVAAGFTGSGNAVESAAAHPVQAALGAGANLAQRTDAATGGLVSQVSSQARRGWGESNPLTMAMTPATESGAAALGTGAAGAFRLAGDKANLGGGVNPLLGVTGVAGAGGFGRGRGKGPQYNAANRDLIDKLLSQKGYTKTQRVAILANLQAESKFDGSVYGDNGTSGGIAQWHNERLQAFAKRYGELPNNNNIDKQVDFLDWELRHSESGALQALQAAGDNPYKATAAFTARFERPASLASAQLARQANAAEILGDKSGQGIQVYYGRDHKGRAYLLDGSSDGAGSSGAGGTALASASYGAQNSGGLLGEDMRGGFGAGLGGGGVIPGMAGASAAGLLLGELKKGFATLEKVMASTNGAQKMAANQQTLAPGFNWQDVPMTQSGNGIEHHLLKVG